jgi:hypothetical protein
VVILDLINLKKNQKKNENFKFIILIIISIIIIMVLSELVNTACSIDRNYKISTHVKNMMVIVTDLQPLIVISIGYYQYVKIFSKLLF